MLDCLIIGDSIAVGAHKTKPECGVYAKGGITSHGWDKLYRNMDLSAQTVVISLGTNDWEKASTYEKLKEIRTKIKAKQVFWIAPNQKSKPNAYRDVSLVAGMFNDTVIWTEHYQQDNIHPSWRGYKELMDKAIKNSNK